MFEWSNQKKYLRRTVWKREAGYQGLSKKEELYVWVSDARERERIKRISGDWDLLIERKKIRDVMLYGQMKYGFLSKQPTGYYKVEEIIDEKGIRKRIGRYYKRVSDKPYNCEI